MREKKKKSKLPEGKKAFWCYLDEELIALLDARIRKGGDLWPVYRSRPEVLQVAIEQFLARNPLPIIEF